MAAFNGKYWYVLSEKSEQGSMLSGIFLLLMLVHGLYKAAGKVSFYCFFPLLLMYVFPQCPVMDEYGVSSSD